MIETPLESISSSFCFNTVALGSWHGVVSLLPPRSLWFLSSCLCEVWPSPPLLHHPDLENRGNAGFPILFSPSVGCGWLGRVSMWLIFHVELSH